MMKWKGRGYKAGLTRAAVRFIKKNIPYGIVYNAPRIAESFANWLLKNTSKGFITPVYGLEHRVERPPEIYNHTVTTRFSKYFTRTIPPAFVAEIRGGSVYGEYTNAILPERRVLAADLSRQFGAYGGLHPQQHVVLNATLKLPRPQYIKGRVAVITTSGADNFHHWLYDCLPRIHQLKHSGKFETINYFLIAHAGQPFQLQSLERTGIDASKIINPKKGGVPFYLADVLVVPSLPSPLGTVSPWVVEFLDNLFNPGSEKNSRFRKIYISRRNAPSRGIINNDAFLTLLQRFGVEEIFPEDYAVAEFAAIVANAQFIISVHGSGLSNLCFASEGAVVVDILAPWHQDSYYWMICNIRHARYIGFFSEGIHPADDLDLVQYKVDDDMKVNLEDLEKLLLKEIGNYNEREAQN